MIICNINNVSNLTFIFALFFPESRFNASTRIRYQLPQEGMVSLRVYNLRGQIVRTLIDGRMERGEWSIVWDGRDEEGRKVSSGIYVYRLVVEGGAWTEARRMVLIK